MVVAETPGDPALSGTAPHESGYIPLAVEAMYPSIPTSCPAKKRRGSPRNCMVGSRSAGELTKVLPVHLAEAYELRGFQPRN